MKRSILFLALSSLFYLNSAKAQLKFKNSETSPIWIAVAYYVETEDYKGFNSDGWYKIDPNSVITIIPSIKYSTYYYYAKDENGAEWTGSGKYKFVVHSRENFTFKNANMEYNASYFEHKVFKNFKKIDVGQAKEYTLNLGETED